MQLNQINYQKSIWNGLTIPRVLNYGKEETE